MRTSSLYLALSIAPLAMCAPVVVSKTSVSGSSQQHPPARVPASRPPHALPEIIHWGPDEDDADFETVIDNRPITPSADADPSVVLQAPRPIVTEYLMSLSVKDQGDKDKEQEQVQILREEEQQENHQQQVVVLSPTKKKEESSARRSVNPEEFLSVAEMDVIIPVFTQRIKITSTPCGEQAKYLSREQSDMIIICLAVIFLFAVVILETCGSFSRRRREGTIKLEDEKNASFMTVNKTRGGLSIQADQA